VFIRNRCPYGIASRSLRQHFDRDVPSERCIGGAIDFAHAAASNSGDYFIRPESSAGTEGHSMSGDAQILPQTNDRQFAERASRSPSSRNCRDFVAARCSHRQSGRRRW
jgi:hypothetical protein